MFWPTSFGNATDMAQSYALNCFDGMKQFIVSNTFKSPSTPHTRNKFLSSLQTPNVTSALSTSGYIKIFLCWSLCIQANATRILLPSSTFKESLQLLSSSGLIDSLFSTSVPEDMFLMIVSFIYFRIVTNPESTACVTEMNDKSFLHLK